ncbi:DNA-directed RNA polymerase II [Actinoplanes sp. GCM10030250]|uniref:DNA-directed RNA polymerase II n=1 Tax=Actinoplanes sp. GCM10030250 TaxID=3273376 RepID=UPI00360CF260
MAPQPPVPDQSPFSRGRAQVTPRTQQFSAEHEPTGTGWPEEHGSSVREPRSLSWHIRRLRRGSEWSNAALIFAFVCWGIWVLSSQGSIVTAAIVFVVTVCVAAGVFALSRLVGRLVLERQMGRTRHTARGSHMVAGLFLVGVGFAHLRQTEWVMTAFHWVTGMFA